ncbi:MAG TPA: flagellar biosynthesis anti-sigma factor FlgM [Methylococcaceae bacterium]|nr:flagellar biosynthesis anti-sigma factor FlgM [Methylococcaceae bacterium]
MNIEITNGPKPVNAVPKRPAEPVALSAPIVGDAAPSGESLSVSLLPVFDEVRQLPEVDAARVAEIKGRIERGEYSIDSGRIARKMLEQEAVFGAAG